MTAADLFGALRDQLSCFALNANLGSLAAFVASVLPLSALGKWGHAVTTRL